MGAMWLWCDQEEQKETSDIDKNSMSCVDTTREVYARAVYVKAD